MTKILAFLVVLLAVLTPSLASACEKGERSVGPVCVIPAGLKAGNKTYPVSVVYFDNDSSKKIVWEGVGYVNAATRKLLTTIETRFVETEDGEVARDVEVEYVWSEKTKKFVER